MSIDKIENAFKKLIDGNKRFIAGTPLHKTIQDAEREKLSKGQSPFAIVVTCSDSRVSPEIIFDQGLGDIFVIRVAGNVLEPISLGSIEYAVEHLNVPLLVLLGHTQCGAVIASVNSAEKPEGNIGAIVEKIKPAVTKAKATGGSKEEIINNSIKENVRLTKQYMLKNSPIIKSYVESGKLKIIMAIYDLLTGKLEIIER